MIKIEHEDLIFEDEKSQMCDLDPWDFAIITENGDPDRGALIMMTPDYRVINFSDTITNVWHTATRKAVRKLKAGNKIIMEVV